MSVSSMAAASPIPIAIFAHVPAGARFAGWCTAKVTGKGRRPVLS